MGFFSWKTQDTHRSISNRYSTLATFRVFMHDNKGNKWEENGYEGYGMFGGKDYHELLAEMNGYGSDRNKGINLFFSGDNILFPQLTQSPHPPSKFDFYIKPEVCEYQGFFY